MGWWKCSRSDGGDGYKPVNTLKTLNYTLSVGELNDMWLTAIIQKTYCCITIPRNLGCGYIPKNDDNSTNKITPHIPMPSTF